MDTGKIIIISTIAFLLIFSCRENTKTSSDKDLVLPAINTEIDFEHCQEDVLEYELYFEEWGGRMGNASIDVIINGDQIIVLQNEKSNLTGGKLLVKGTLAKHKSGKWIIAEEPDDIYAEEIGGCSTGPIEIDLENKIVMWC